MIFDYLAIRALLAPQTTLFFTLYLLKAKWSNKQILAGPLQELEESAGYDAFLLVDLNKSYFS